MIHLDVLRDTPPSKPASGKVRLAALLKNIVERLMVSWKRKAPCPLKREYKEPRRHRDHGETQRILSKEEGMLNGE